MTENGSPEELRGWLCNAMMRVGTYMATVFDREMAHSGLTQAQFRTLLSLLAEPLSPGELARRSLLEKATVSLVAQRMVAAGWLQRLPGANRRTHLLGLTEKGQLVLQACLPAANNLAKLATGVLDQGEQQQLQSLLVKLENHLRENT